MKNIFLSFCLLLSVSFLYAGDNRPNFSLVGFATQNGGTTGGNSAGADKIITVTSIDELQKAIGGEKTTTPRIIKVVGKIGPGEIAIKNCANITIFGADENAFISQTPIVVTNSSNIIIRNLKFSMVGKSGGKDIIELTTTGSAKSENIWIDHCEFFNETPTAEGADNGSVKDKYDGLLDMKKGSAYITISWCYFHDHYKGLLVGFSTDKDPEDRKITMHHNRFVRINSRIPSYRAGTSHIYNNYIEGWIENGIRYGNAVHARDAANLLVENNYFKDLNRTVYWDVNDSPTEGFAYGTGNIYDNVTHEMTTRTHSSPFVPPYQVDQDDAQTLPDVLQQYAGVGILSSYDDYGGQGDENKAPVVSITSPNANAVFDAPAAISVAATVTDEDGSISKVEFYINGTLSETLTEAPYSSDFIGLTAGNYTFTIRAYDDKNKFSSKTVTATVQAPPIESGESLFGSTVATDDYFWFGDNAAVINSLLSDNTISGSATFNSTVDPQIDNKSITTHKGGLVIPKEGGDVVFSLPSCTLFKLYLTRTGSFDGDVFVSIDTNNWGNAVSSIAGKKGFLEVDITEYATSAEQIYVRIVNKSTGGMNIHGASIRLAKKTLSFVEIPNMDKTVILVKYYNLSGISMPKPEKGMIYIQETVYDDGSVMRMKYLER